MTEAHVRGFGGLPSQLALHSLDSLLTSHKGDDVIVLSQLLTCVEWQAWFSAAYVRQAHSARNCNPLEAQT